VARRSLRFHPAAVEEAERAREWYFARSPPAAAAFLRELEGALEAVRRNPRRWHTSPLGTRVLVFSRLPFRLIYRLRDDVVEVIAIAHAKRKPDYWESR